MTVDVYKGVYHVLGTMHCQKLGGDEFWALQSIEVNGIGCSTMVFIPRNTPSNFQEESKEVLCVLETHSIDNTGLRGGFDATIRDYEPGSSIYTLPDRLPAGTDLHIEGTMHLTQEEGGEGFWEIWGSDRADGRPPEIFKVKDPPAYLQHEGLQVVCDLKILNNGVPSTGYLGIEVEVVDAKFSSNLQ